jgi:hypothetical protein
VAVGDFLGNGVLDLAVANQADNTVSVLLGNGDGSFQAAVRYAGGSSPSSLAVGDFNGDGILDLAVTDSAVSGGSPGVSVLLGNGVGSFQAAQNFSAGSGPASVAVGDFNGDGLPDLAVADFDSGQVSVLLNDGVWTGPSTGAGSRRSSGTHLIPRTESAARDLAAAEGMRRDSGAAVSPLAATVTFANDSQPLRGADAEQAGTRAIGAAVSTPKPPARAPVWARAERTVPRLLDRLFAEPESGALGVPSAGEPWWSRP